MHAAFAMLRLMARAAHYKELPLRLIQPVGKVLLNESPTPYRALWHSPSIGLNSRDIPA
jgi:hypothetical protein